MAEKKVVISIFEDEAAADVAVVALDDAGVALKDAIGILANWVRKEALSG